MYIFICYYINTFKVLSAILRAMRLDNLQQPPPPLISNPLFEANQNTMEKEKLIVNVNEMIFHLTMN